MNKSSVYLVSGEVVIDEFRAPGIPGGHDIRERVSLFYAVQGDDDPCDMFLKQYPNARDVEAQFVAKLNIAPGALVLVNEEVFLGLIG